MVVSATRGEAGQIRDARAATRRMLGKARVQELERSCTALGVQHTLCLDFGDGTLRDVVITFGPDGAYGHPDHIAIGEITTQAFTLAGEAENFPEQIASGLKPYSPARLYHSYFPRSQKLLSEKLVQWLVASEERFKGTVDFAHALFLFSDM